MVQQLSDLVYDRFIAGKVTIPQCYDELMAVIDAANLWEYHQPHDAIYFDNVQGNLVRAVRKLRYLPELTLVMFEVGKSYRSDSGCEAYIVKRTDKTIVYRYVDYRGRERTVRAKLRRFGHVEQFWIIDDSGNPNKDRRHAVMSPRVNADKVVE